ncbi:hypothetical protein FMUND_4083 [Fusarium mundagurra]|uniref:Uncharacterized protein n=1 Tax=Fusarium mundagurra TaxID=1567541 RepID=A0A8H5YX34_9HYPO|nr:hypothetical protein FMUND_4083 [Fusarium mundagurra]
MRTTQNNNTAGPDSFFNSEFTTYHLQRNLTAPHHHHTRIEQNSKLGSLISTNPKTSFASATQKPRIDVSLAKTSYSQNYQSQVSIAQRFDHTMVETPAFSLASTSRGQQGSPPLSGADHRDEQSCGKSVQGARACESESQDEIDI